MKRGRIAVVGAGISGLTAAQSLAGGQHDLVVFEKARGVGGRTSTRRHEGSAFDHGAQWRPITEEGPTPGCFDEAHRWRFARAARPLGTPYLWDPDLQIGVCGDWTCGARVQDGFISGKLLARAMLGERVAPTRQT